MRKFTVVLAVLMFASYGCNGGCGGGADSNGSAQPDGIRFADAMVGAIRSPKRKNVRSVMAPKDFVFAAKVFIDLRSSEQRYLDYEQFIRGKILEVREELTARGFRWQKCALTAASILLVNTKDQPTDPATKWLHTRMVFGEKVATAELLPHLVPLTEDLKHEEGIVFLFLEDGAQEAVVRVDTMPTRQGRRIELLGPRIEVQNVGPLNPETKGS